jgi:hypothetical protein
MGKNIIIIIKKLPLPKNKQSETYLLKDRYISYSRGKITYFSGSYHIISDATNHIATTNSIINVEFYVAILSCIKTRNLFQMMC